MLGHSVTLASGEPYVVRSICTEAMVDFQNTHAGISMIQSPPSFGNNCSGDCQDPTVFALPSGLSRIMR